MNFYLFKNIGPTKNENEKQRSNRKQDQNIQGSKLDTVNEVSIRAEAESEEVIAYNKNFKYYHYKNNYLERDEHYK